MIWNFNADLQLPLQEIEVDKTKKRDLGREQAIRTGYSEELYNNSVIHRIPPTPEEPQHTFH